MRRTTWAASAAVLAVAFGGVLSEPTTGATAGLHTGRGSGVQAENGRIFFSTGFVLPDPDPGGTIPQVYSVAPNGSHLKTLTHVPDGAMAGDPSVSPDGRTVAYVSNEPGSFGVWMMTRGGADQHQVLATPDTNYYLPSWAPDGETLLVSACDSSLGFDAWCDLVAVEADGTNARTVVADHRYNLGGQYSPDGRKIQFQSDREGLAGAIWVMSAAGGAPHRVTPSKTEAFLGAWSPDGRRIVFGDNCCQRHTNIWTVAPSGRHLTELTHVPFGHDTGFPTYSPDGRFIAMTSNVLRRSDSPKLDLFTLHADGSHLRRIESRHQPALLSSWAAVPGAARTNGENR